MAALLVGSGFHFHRKFVELRSLRRRQMEYEQRVRELEARVALLTREIEEIHANPEYLERLARERLGLAGEDETIFIIEPAPAEE